MTRIGDSLISYIPSGKYDSPRDAFLDYMVSVGWANEANGDVESNAGHYAIVKNPPAEIAEIAEAFSEELSGLDITADDITGYFVVATNSEGNVTVHDFETETAADIVYAEFERDYSNWLINSDEESLEGQCAGCESFDHTWNACPNN